MRLLKLGRSYHTRFSPDGARCVTISREVNIWDIGARMKMLRLHPFPHPSSADFSPDGRYLVVKSTGGRMVVLEGETGRIVSDFRTENEGEGAGASFSACGNYLIDGSWQGFLRVRQIVSGEIVFEKQFPGEMITSVTPIQDRARWLITHKPKATQPNQPPADGYCTLWNWPMNKNQYQIFPKKFPFLTHSSLNAAGTKCATIFGAPPISLQIWSLPEGRVSYDSAISGGETGKEVGWSKCGRFLGYVGGTKISVLNGETAEIIQQYPIEYPSGVEFSPDSKMIALSSWSESRIEPFDG